MVHLYICYICTFIIWLVNGKTKDMGHLHTQQTKNYTKSKGKALLLLHMLHLSFWLFKVGIAVLALIIVEGPSLTYSCYFLCHLVFCEESSHWQSYHIFFFILTFFTSGPFYSWLCDTCFIHCWRVFFYA